MKAVFFIDDEVARVTEVKEGFKVDIKTISDWKCDYIIFTTKPDLLKINQRKKNG